MANREHVEILTQGVDTWNQWRRANPDVQPDLTNADLSQASLDGVNFRNTMLLFTNLNQTSLVGANLSEADLQHAKLASAQLSQGRMYKTNISFANLSRATLLEADMTAARLVETNLDGARLDHSTLVRADMYEARLVGASLIESNLNGALLVRTNIEGADLSSCSVYGISAWDIHQESAIQTNLIVTPGDEPVITVDNLEMAQFIYLLLNNEKIRNVINTITSKVVLILGRFTPERKAVLDAIREELRNHDLLPVLFDFDKPATRDIHETVTTLARMARFVIADITDPKSIPQELVSIVEQLPSLPVQPILHEGGEPWGMYGHIKPYPWVLAIHHYKDLNDLLVSLEEKVIGPAEAKVIELQQ